ncbi:MAG: hypothetical protein ACTHLE_10300 [Agriterribacter sp.]
MDELLLKFLDGQVSLSEEMAVKSWIEHNDDNLRYFQYFANSWNESCTPDNALLFSSIAAIQ